MAKTLQTKRPSFTLKTERGEIRYWDKDTLVLYTKDNELYKQLSRSRRLIRESRYTQGFFGPMVAVDLFFSHSALPMLLAALGLDSRGRPRVRPKTTQIEAEENAVVARARPKIQGLADSLSICERRGRC